MDGYVLIHVIGLILKNEDSSNIKMKNQQPIFKRKQLVIAMSVAILGGALSGCDNSNDPTAPPPPPAAGVFTLVANGGLGGSLGFNEGGDGGDINVYNDGAPGGVEVRNAGAANASFTSIVPFAQTILHQVISSLEKAREVDENFTTVSPAWMVSFSSICGISVKEGQHFEALSGCLSILNNKGYELYEPVTENIALISEFFLLLFLLNSHVLSINDNESNNGISLGFKNEGGIQAGNKVLYLNADPAVISSGDEINTPTGNNHLTLALGQAGSHIRPSLRRVSNKDQSRGCITPKTIVTLGWQHIFYEKPYDGNMDSVADTLMDAVNSPTNYYFENLPSLKRRTYLREV